jgi:PEP-CTERM motif
MVKGATCLAICYCLAGAGNVLAQMTVSNTPVADAFVRSADPAGNNGGAGALEVSGLIATNASGVQQGQFDTFMRFDVSSEVAAFNSNFGTGNWALSSVALKLTEVAAPNNAVFNRGIGQFQVQWIANDSWIEGTGNPGATTTNGIVFNDEANTTVLSDGEAQLGTFSNTGANGLRTYALGTPSSFINDITAGGLVSFYLDPTTNSTIGFNFDSRSFGTASAQPFLVLTAVVVPEPATVGLVGFSVLALIASRRRRKNKHAAVD